MVFEDAKNTVSKVDNQDIYILNENGERVKVTSLPPYTNPPTVKDRLAAGRAENAAHYQGLATQAIEIIQHNLTEEMFLGFCLGNCIKYACRCGHKDDIYKEVGKIHEYSGWFMEAAEGKTIVPPRGGGKKDDSHTGSC